MLSKDMSNNIFNPLMRWQESKGNSNWVNDVKPGIKQVSEN